MERGTTGCVVEHTTPGFVHVAKCPDFGDGGRTGCGVLATVKRDGIEARGESGPRARNPTFVRPLLKNTKRKGIPITARDASGMMG